MTALIKLAGEWGVDLPQLIFWRHSFTVLMLFGVLALSGRLGMLRTKRGRSHASRAMIGTFGLSLTFIGLRLLPLPEATALGFTAPLFAVIASALFLRERIGAWRWSAVLLGIGGILLVTRPTGEVLPPLGVGAILIATMVMVLMNFVVRGLGRTESPVTITFYAALFGSMIVSLALPFSTLPNETWQWALMLAASLAGGLGQMLMAQSLRHGHISSVITMEYTGLIWATLLGWLVWGHLPPAATWMGSPLIVAAGLIVAWREHRQASATVPATN